MMGKIVGVLAVLLAGGAVYMGSCFLCIANHNSVSEAEYVRMAREIVEQSIVSPAAECGQEECRGI